MRASFTEASSLPQSKSATVLASLESALRSASTHLSSLPERLVSRNPTTFSEIG